LQPSSWDSCRPCVDYLSGDTRPIRTACAF
jgi:hypothetical protein